ncbi:hypothetical protein PISMIDRAFT_680834 [Pisolithus microcarpus 441]|uniref:Uncharacterized protein n=1 Tax=Pisolithus microcarpus 441 TaxID=765257 RepID=A0A0C9ZQS5_9AGAM|nr:hypothetical protein PISMIDRAFT_680834 [Pisolithus microcarpus 441]
MFVYRLFLTRHQGWIRRPSTSSSAVPRHDSRLVTSLIVSVVECMQYTTLLCQPAHLRCPCGSRLDVDQNLSTSKPPTDQPPFQMVTRLC